MLLLGKNGEPRSDQKVDVRLKHRILEECDTTLITDSTGSISLGALKDCTELIVDSNSIKVGAKWQLSNPGLRSCDWKYPKTLELLEGAKVELPIQLDSSESSLDPKTFSLIKSVNGLIVENWFDKAELTKGQNAFFSI